MTDSNLSQSELDSLENLIDARGIEDVLMAISEICSAKAEHIAETWEDARLARRWDTVAGAVGVAVPHATGL